MALSSDEQELLHEIEEGGIEDFYAGVFAITLYRFQKETKLSRQVPTETIGKMVIGVFNDITEFHEAEELKEHNTPG